MIDFGNQFSSSKTADGTKQQCAQAGRKVVRVRWNVADFVWCSDEVPIIGVTENYGDGEEIPIALNDRRDASKSYAELQTTVRGNAFEGKWRVVNVLPSRDGEGGYRPRLEVDGRAGNARTPVALHVRFLNNQSKSDYRFMKVDYRREDPALKEEERTFSIYTNFWIGVENYLLSIYGDLEYVRGWGKWILELGPAKPPGGFEIYKTTYHWGKQNKLTGLFEYWDGTGWQATPTGWAYKNETVLALSFWKKGNKWICREDEKLEWPGGVTDWKPADYSGPGNPVERKLGEWKKQIEELWTDTFDLKRVGCASTRPECCRYKTRCVVTFNEVTEARPGVIVVGNSMFRSNASLWSLGDTDADLAPHEFGHLIGNPDEYEGANRTQTGVKDDDGLVNGIDGNSIMGPNKAIVKRRHLKGVIQAMEWIAEASYGRKYTYEAVPKGANLALPPGTPRGLDLGQSPVSEEPEEKNRLLGAAVGGVIGGLAGALAGVGAGYAMGKKDSNLAVGAGAAGAAIGAALGYFL